MIKSDYQLGIEHGRAEVKDELPDVGELKNLVIKADLNFNKMPCFDDEFNEYCAFIAKDIADRIKVC